METSVILYETVYITELAISMLQISVGDTGTDFELEKVHNMSVTLTAIVASVTVWVVGSGRSRLYRYVLGNGRWLSGQSSSSCCTWWQPLLRPDRTGQVVWPAVSEHQTFIVRPLDRRMVLPRVMSVIEQLVHAAVLWMEIGASSHRCVILRIAAAGVACAAPLTDCWLDFLYHFCRDESESCVHVFVARRSDGGRCVTF